MKNIKLYAYAVLLSILSLTFINSITKNTEVITPLPVPSNVFMLGAMNNAADANYNYISDPDAFGMNLWHYTINN